MQKAPEREMKKWLQGHRFGANKNEEQDPYSSANEAQILVLDGGVSTHLEEYVRRQLLIDPPFSNRALWSSSLLLTSQGRNAIQTCHEAFLDAGSDIVSTVTYQCHYQGLNNIIVQIEDESGLLVTRPLQEADMDQMIRDGVKLAKAAADSRKQMLLSRPLKSGFVAASIGCYGAALADGSEYRGKYDVRQEKLIHFFRRKVSILLETQPDALAFETVPDFNECLAIMDLLQEFHEKKVSLPAIWLSLACKDGTHLNDGTPIINVLDIIQIRDPQANIIQAIGVNCCSCAHVTALTSTIAKRMVDCSRTLNCSIVLYPNSGEEWDASSEKWKPGTGCTDAKDFADLIHKSVNVIQNEFQQDHVREGKVVPNVIVGGCCRTSIENIAAIRRKVDGARETKRGISRRSQN